MLDVITTRPLHVRGEVEAPEVISLMGGQLERLAHTEEEESRDESTEAPAVQVGPSAGSDDDWFFDDTPSMPLATPVSQEEEAAVLPETRLSVGSGNAAGDQLPFAVTSECLTKSAPRPGGLRSKPLILTQPPIPVLEEVLELSQEAVMTGLPPSDLLPPQLRGSPDLAHSDEDPVDMLEALEATDEELDEPSPAPRRPEAALSGSAQGSPAGMPLRVRTTRVSEERVEPDSPLAQSDGRLRELLESSELREAMEGFRNSTLVLHAALLEQGLEVLLLASDHSSSQTPDGWFDDLQRVARQLIALRPALSYVGFACSQLVYELKLQHSRGDDLSTLKRGLEQRIARFLQDEHAARQDLASEIERLLTPSAVVVTRGDAGIVLDALRQSHTFGIRIVVPEERPGWEGRLFAMAVLELGRNVTLSTDWGVTALLQECDMVILEASGLLLDGSVLAKAGSRALAQVASACKKPVYVASTLQRVELRLGDALPTAPEQRRMSDVWDHVEPRLEVRNLTAERVPSELISGIITEEGPLLAASLRHEVLSREHLREALGIASIPGAA